MGQFFYTPVYVQKYWVEPPSERQGSNCSPDVQKWTEKYLPPQVDIYLSADKTTCKWALLQLVGHFSLS